jgi:hypothetical protein
MISMNSPYDPMFFLHHSFVDYLWKLWQDTHVEDLDRMHRSQDMMSRLLFDGVRDTFPVTDVSMSMDILDDDPSTDSQEKACVYYHERRNGDHACSSNWNHIQTCLSYVVKAERLHEIPRIKEMRSVGDVCSPLNPVHADLDRIWLETMAEMGMLVENEVGNILKWESTIESRINRNTPTLDESEASECDKALCFSTQKLLAVCAEVAATMTTTTAGYEGQTTPSNDNDYEATTAAPGGNGYEATTAAPGGNGYKATTAAPGGNGYEATTASPGGNGYEATTTPPGGNGYESTTTAPGGNGYEATTTAPGGNGYEITTEAPGGPGHEATTQEPTTAPVEPTTQKPTTAPVNSTTQEPTIVAPGGNDTKATTTPGGYEPEAKTTTLSGGSEPKATTTTPSDGYKPVILAEHSGQKAPKKEQSYFLDEDFDAQVEDPFEAMRARLAHRKPAEDDHSTMLQLIEG